ncbi:Peptidyl-prolyl isomerase cwc27, partial [Coemansia sp. RSA 2049]
EPPTSGKVVLETTAGSIEIELWSKETPKTCRNFVQLCMEGYFDGTIFHRVVPGWIAQGGDPSGTGEGMANSGPNDNRSQFFITLASTPELQKKNTLFGTVVGNSVFNALKLGEGEVDKESERPTYPRKDDGDVVVASSKGSSMKSSHDLLAADPALGKGILDGSVSKSKSKDDNVNHISTEANNSEAVVSEPKVIEKKQDTPQPSKQDQETVYAGSVDLMRAQYGSKGSAASKFKG